MPTLANPPPHTFPSTVVLDHLADGILVTDVALDGPDGPQIVYANEAFTEITGYTADELMGKSPRVLQGPKTDRALMARLHDDLLAGRSFSGQTTNYRKDGTPFMMEWSIAAVPGDDGTPRWFVAVQRDATMPARRLLEAERDARVDTLTGLPNRRHFDDMLTTGAWLSSRTRSALILDLDHFKAVNDRHGHLVGDEVLREVGRRLRGALRDGDLVARWGGEEFCVLTLDSGIGAAGLAERLLATIAAAPILTAVGPLAVTASIGGATMRDDRTEARQIIEAADEALYEAKRTGRNRVCLA